MGIDYDQGSGILVTLDQMLTLITEENYKLAQNGIMFAGSEIEEWSEKDCSELTQISSKEYTYKQFMEWFEKFHEIKGEPGKYGGDAEFANGFYPDTVGTIWFYIVESIKAKLPDFQCEIFNSGRQAMDCPLGEPCFIFSEEGCYTKRLNANGKRLEALAGELKYVEWTDISY